MLANLLASPPAAAQGSAAAATVAPNRCSEALLRVWGFEVYTARLCAGADFRADAFARAPFTLELRYLRAFKAADIARRSIEEMRRGGPLDAAQAQAWREQLERALPDVQPGDRLTGIHEPGRGVRFLYNGQPWRSPWATPCSPSASSASGSHRTPPSPRCARRCSRRWAPPEAAPPLAAHTRPAAAAQAALQTASPP